MLTLALFCESLMQLILDVEVYFRAQGDREAIQNHTLASMKKGTIPTTITYLISTIVAAVFYFGSFEPVDPGIWNVTDIPLTLTGAGYLLSVCMKISATLQKPTGMADIRDTLVPYNIDFVIQRYSDWFLLLIGEVVMAMVETTNAERNFVVTSMGSLIMIVMFTLKFESEPDNPHAHALWRNTRNASAFRIMTEFTSTGMIGMSVIFKVLLAEGRFGLSAQDCTIAFTVSLAWVLIALELTLITHKGLQRTWARLFRPDMSSSALTIRSFYWPLALITMWKVFLLIFLLTLPVWQDDPNKAIIFAFFAVWSVAITRIVGWAFIFKEDEIQKIVSKTKDKLKSVAGSDRTISDSSLPVKVMHSFNEESDRLTTVEEDDESVASMTRQQSETYNGMFDAVIFADFEGSIVSVNNVAVKMFRYKAKSDMIGQNVAMLVGGDHAHKHASYMKRFRERGNKLVFGKQRKLKARRSDGEEFHCLLGITLAGNGKHTIAFIRDLEDFAEDFDLLLPDVETKTEKQLKRVLDDNSFDSIAVIDLDGNIVGVNSTFLKEFRYDSKEEVLGLDIAIIMDSHYQKIHKKMMARYVETRKKGATFPCKVVGRQNLLPVLRKDGSQFKCIIGVSPIEDSDMLVGFIKNVESLMP